MAATRLVLVRHGQTDWNLAGRFQGQADIPLNDAGRAQARVMAPVVARMKPDALWSSDLSRARETAAAISEVTGLVARESARLQEINVGTWAGLTMDDAELEMPDFRDALRAGRDFRRSPTGETAGECGARVAAVLREIAQANQGMTTVVVGHGLALRMAMMALVGLEFSAGLALGGLWNCSWTVLERGERWRLLSYNNVAPAIS